jgi:hypothetical protein
MLTSTRYDAREIPFAGPAGRRGIVQFQPVPRSADAFAKHQSSDPYGSSSSYFTGFPFLRVLGVPALEASRPGEMRQ